jgi:hypothetical protein
MIIKSNNPGGYNTSGKRVSQKQTSKQTKSPSMLVLLVLSYTFG